MMRYLSRLEKKDLSLNYGMIPLGLLASYDTTHHSPIDIYSHFFFSSFVGIFDAAQVLAP